jgi:hypothetical protein
MAKNSVFLTISIIEKPVKSKIIVRYSGRQSTKEEPIFKRGYNEKLTFSRAIRPFYNATSARVRVL